MPRVVWTAEAEAQLVAVSADETVAELLALTAGLNQSVEDRDNSRKKMIHELTRTDTK